MPPRNSRHREQSAVGTGHGVEPPIHHCANATCEDATRQIHVADEVELPRFFGQQAHHFDDKKGVAFGFALEHIEQIRLLAHFLAEHGHGQRFDVLAGEAAEFELAHGGDFDTNIRFVVPIAGNEQKGGGKAVFDGRRQPFENGDAFTACPLQIFEDDHEGRTLPRKHALQQLPQLALGRLGVFGGGAGGEFTAEQLPHIGDEWLEDAGFVVA